MPLVSVGVVQSSFGVRGDLKCAYTTDHPEWIAGRKQYLLCDPRSSEALLVHPLQVTLREDGFLIRLKEFDAPEQIKLFSGWELAYFAKRGELPRDELGDVYLFELAGLEVRDAQGQAVARVKDILDNGPHYLLVLDLPGEPMIPYIDQHVPEVNLAEGYLVTTYPLGPEGKEIIPPSKDEPLEEGSKVARPPAHERSRRWRRTGPAAAAPAAKSPRKGK